MGASVTDASGSFIYTWIAGTTEGTVELRFTAKQPDFAESNAIPFILEINGTKPYLVSGSAKADALLGSASTITVVSNEPAVINDMDVFTFVHSPFILFPLGVGTHFDPNQPWRRPENGNPYR